MVCSDVILEVKTIDNKSVFQFTDAEIRRLPQVTFSTFDPWDNKQRRYTGTPVIHLLKHIQMDRTISLIQIIAHNDYKAKMTMNEIKKYNPILSYEMDGKRYASHGKENKGDLAVAIKMEAVDEPDLIRAKNQLVWWIKTIILIP